MLRLGYIYYRYDCTHINRWKYTPYYSVTNVVKKLQVSIYQNSWHVLRMFKKSVGYNMNQLINKEINLAELRQDRRFMLPWVKSHSYVTSSQQERWASHKQSENELSSSLLHIIRRHTWTQRQGAKGREQWGAECTKVIDLRRRNGTKRCCNIVVALLNL